MVDADGAPIMTTATGPTAGGEPDGQEGAALAETTAAGHGETGGVNAATASPEEAPASSLEEVAVKAENTTTGHDDGGTSGNGAADLLPGSTAEAVKETKGGEAEEEAMAASSAEEEQNKASRSNLEDMAFV
ncbi:unnamed protein product [Heterosigma akashiwo]